MAATDTHAPCSCDEAARNRQLAEKRDPRHVPAEVGPNEDGEFICAFCWEVLNR